jgi:hypothetical protein
VDSKVIPLGPFPVRLTTSTVNGQIVIVTPAVDKVGAAPYQIALTAFKPPTPSNDRIAVSPAQRVQSLMSGIKTGKDLAGLVDSKGNKIFEGESEDNLTSIALFSSCVNEATNPSPPKLESDSMPKDIALKQPESSTASSSHLHARRNILGDIWDNAVEAVDNFGHAVGDTVNKVKDKVVKVGGKVIQETQNLVGDLIEGVKNGVKALGKLAMQVVGPVLRFAVGIAGKMVSFALKGIGFVLKGVSAGLKALGVDTKKLDNWIEYLFDGDSTEKTQRVSISSNLLVLPE